MSTRALVNEAYMGQVYPRSNASAGLRGTTPAEADSETTKAVPTTGEIIPGSNPVATLLVFLGMLFVLMFAATKLGSRDDYSNIRASAYNVLIIGLAAATFIPLLKIAAVKVKGPWTSYILAI